MEDIKLAEFTAFLDHITEDEWVECDTPYFSYQIRRNMSLDTYSRIQDYVVNMCFSDDTGYKPWLLDPALRMAMIENCTNIQWPDNVEARFALCYRTNIYHDILDEIDQDQFFALQDAIERELEYKMNCSEARERLANKVVHAMDVIYGTLVDLEAQLTTKLGDNKFDLDAILADMKAAIDETVKNSGGE